MNQIRADRKAARVVKNISDFIADLNALDIRLGTNGNGLSIDAPEGALTPQLKNELTKRKLEILQFLRPPSEKTFSTDDGWPQECLDSEGCYRQPHSRLFPLVGKMVNTPFGKGMLLQVFEKQARVVLVGDDKSTAVDPGSILPSSTHSEGRILWSQLQWLKS